MKDKVVNDKIAKGKKKAVKEQNFKSEKKLLVILVVIFGVLLVAMIVVAIAFLVIRPWENNENVDEAPSENVVQVERVEGVDYEQKITSEDGGEFVPKVMAGTDSNLAMRFSELKCSDGCKNVENVKFGDRVLTLDKDYEVKQGSVIIVIFAAVFSKVEPGEVVITFEITEDNKIQTIGAKITIEKQEEKKEEQNTNANTNASVASNATSNAVASAASNATSNAAANAAAAAKAACESRTDGPYGVAIVHFVTASEKAAGVANNGWTDDTVATMAVFTGDNMKMKYVDGVCRPTAIASTPNLIGIGAQPYTRQMLLNYGITETSDFVQWQYTDGRVVRQTMANPSVIWSW